MKIKYAFLLIIIFTAKIFASSENFRYERDTVIHEALIKFKNVMASKGYYAGGIGEGVNHDNRKQNYLKVVFVVDNLENIESARHLEVETIKTFLDCINSEEGIQDYLDEYPFPVKYICIAFASRHPEKGLSTVWNFQEEIIYNQHDSNKEIAPSFEVHRETYDEAVHLCTRT